MTQENPPVEDGHIQRPLSPFYHELKLILAEADVLLLPTDRDLAPTDHRNDEVDPA